MKRIRIGFLGILLLAFLSSCLSVEATDIPAEKLADSLQTMPESKESDSIHQFLAKIVNDGKAPGIIAAIISGEGINVIASAGERKSGSEIAFTTKDYVHLGSCTKAMTSTMIATLVAEGKLNWESKLIDVIPEFTGKIHSDYYNITLWQLLTHHAGLPKNPKDWGAYEHKEIKARRLAILIDNLQEPATYECDGFHYSNFGYMIAACMAEKVSGLSWETLMKKRLFDPLGMSSAGFGAPNTYNQTDQPWGHSSSWLRGKWQPDQTDNPEALGPAGRIHCSIEDWAKFLSLHLIDKNPVLERKYLNKLIEPVDGHFYAGGWGVADEEDQPWAKGKAFTHNGSNGIWYTSVMVVPKLNRAYIVSTNSRDFGITEDVCSKMIGKLIRMDLKIMKD